MQHWQSEFRLTLLAGLVLVAVSGCASSSYQQNDQGAGPLSGQMRGREVQDEVASVTGIEELEKLEDREGQERIGRCEDQMARLRWRLMEAQAMPLIHF